MIIYGTSIGYKGYYIKGYYTKGDTRSIDYSSIVFKLWGLG